MGNATRPDSNLPEVSNLESSFPEAVERNDYPIAVPRDAEGMQAVQQSCDQGHHQPNTRHDNEKVPQDSTTEQAARKKSKLPRRGWIILVVILAIAIILAVGVGAGLGIGLNSGSKKR
jgi:hypothetical protein